MTSETMADNSTSHVLGRRPKSTPDDIILVAWSLFERDGFDATTMADVAAAVGISRRTLFNYFATKEALLYPAVDEYMEFFGALLMNRPRDEPLFQSLEYCLHHSHEKQIELEERFNPGPKVHAARLSDGAVRYSRDHWAQEMEHVVARRLAGLPGGAALAGFVGALAAQVWTEITKHLRAAGPDGDISEALADVMSSLRKLFS
jgi:AcrR family transcriptional regulator